MAISKNTSSVSSIILDGDDWQLAIDPENVGREQHWYREPTPEAKPTRVPWIIQDPFPSYHGVAWYWHDFSVSPNPHEQGRYLLRFWAVDYKADVWLNGRHVGGHEGGETPFTLDVTEAIKSTANRIAVRVLNPTHDRIDDIVLKETPHRCKTIPFCAGAAYNHGGIVDSVELMPVPAVYIENLFCRPDLKSGLIHIHATVRNTAETPMAGRFVFAVAPACGGRGLNESRVVRELASGETLIEAALQVDSPRLWELNDPYLYCVTANLQTDKSNSADEHVTRCGFRDFRFEDGYFHLNGRRIFLRCSHTCNHYPIGLQFPHDADFARRDMLNAKVMGFNMVRFIWGGSKRSQLDLCDEIGLMVYNESYAAFPMVDSPRMVERYDSAVTGIIRRDRNHPCIVIWGLLNETHDGPLFQHAVSILPTIRSLDDSRVVMLGSGRWDARLDIGSICNPGSMAWERLLGGEEPNAPLSKSMPGGYFEHVGDAHVYPRVPHTAETFGFLRAIGHDTKHVFLSEYGVGSAVDLWRTVRHYERLGKDCLEDAKFYQDKLNRYLADWESWRLDECFDQPDDFFLQSLRKMASQRTLGLNAIRANPNLVGYSLTGLIDHVMAGEGLTTPFREFKPGTMDAMSDGWAPLRLCLFANPVNIYSGARVKLEAVLANEDALPPGEYPVRLRVVGPKCTRLFDHTVMVKIPDSKNQSEPPFALPVFSEEILIEGPSGKYRFLAMIEKGAAATGGETEFYVADSMEMPVVGSEMVLWGQDYELVQWFSSRGIRVRPLDSARQPRNEVILVSTKPTECGGGKVFDELVQRIYDGATAVFLSPDVFKAETSIDGAKSAHKYAAFPFDDAGSFTENRGWLYHKDEWAKNHPIFEGLPAGGLMDYTFYREIIPDTILTTRKPPAEAVAGAIDASLDYSSGLMVSVHNHGKGHFILNTLLIRENLGKHPAAERLLRNMLRYAFFKAKL